MSFLWPELLWLALWLAPLAWLRVRLLRRRERQIARACPGLLAGAGSAAPHANGRPWRADAPAWLLLTGLAALVVAMARPVLLLPEVSTEQTVVLAIDLSGSMSATDVEPSRLAAAQQSAKQFIAGLPAGVQVAVVAYADSAELVQPPTPVHARAAEAIDRFMLQGGTAIGDGILAALRALFPGQALDPGEVLYRAVQQSMQQVPSPGAEPASAPASAPPGSYTAGLIVLLTDGENTMGTDPLEAAQMAADRGVKVYTVGFGTHEGAIVRSEGASERVGIDEAGLKEIARITRGEYFRATSGPELQRVYRALKGRLVMRDQVTEVSAVVAGLAALLLLGAAGLSLWRWGTVA